MTNDQFPTHPKDNRVLIESDDDQIDALRWGIDLEPEKLVLKETSVQSKQYDLGERTAMFGEAVIRFAQRIPIPPVNNRLIDQLVGAGTSVGANYCEADEGVSRKDFMHRIGTCQKEVKETQFFLRMVVAAQPDLKDVARPLWLEARELKLIFASIFRQR